MKNKIFIGAFILLLTITTSSFAQFNPNTEGRGLASAGFGISNWGIPIYLRYEHPVADNITVGGLLSFQSKGYASWRGTYYGIVGRSSYHFNELLNVPDQFDIYGGASLGYYIYKWKYNNGYNNDFYNPSSGEPNFGIHAGATYFIKDNFGINTELLGGLGFNGITVGVLFLL